MCNVFRRLTLLAALAIALVATSPALAQSWNQWRGPARDGTAKLSVPSPWPEQLTKAWQVEVGIGHASPVVEADKIYVFSREEDAEVLRALNPADGSELFRKHYEAPYKMHPAARGHGKGPKSTPLAAAGRVYTLGISGILTAWSAADGRQLWQREFSKQFKTTSPLYGTATSPILERGLLIAHVGGHDSGALTAFDAQSGDVRWAWKEDGPGYTSPIIATVAGKRQLITQSQAACISVAPESGQLLWKLPFKTPYDQNIVTPVVHEGLVVFSGTGKSTFAVRPAAGAGATPETAWNNDQIPQYMSSQVKRDGFLYGVTNRNSGQLFCAEAGSGEVRWRGQPRLGKNASLLLTGDVLLVLNDGGTLLVIKAQANEYEEIARFQLAETATWAHLVPLGEHGILIKDETTLAHWTWK